MIEQISNALVFYAFYTASKAGKTELADVTVDVYRNGAEVVTAAAASEVGDGLYKYTLASGSVNEEGEYITIFTTADTTVDLKTIPAIWVVQKAGVENLDGTVTSRAAPEDAMTLTAAAVDAILDETVEGTYTLRQMLRLALAALAAKCSGGGTTTITFRDLNDSKNRIVATVDANGNRTAVTVTAT